MLGKHSPLHFGNAAWSDAGVICPWEIYRHYGDKKILAENYDAMKRWIAYQERTSKNLVRPRTLYGDWLAIDAVTAQNAPVPCDLVGTAYFAHTTDLMAKIAGVLGRKADAPKFRQLHERIVRPFAVRTSRPTAAWSATARRLICWRWPSICCRLNSDQKPSRTSSI